MTDTDDARNENSKPAPACPICTREMTLKVEQSDDDKPRRVWICPDADKHEPYHWWRYMNP